MTPDLYTFALRALLRLGSTGNSALSQYARDKAAVFPELRQPQPDLEAFVAGFFSAANRVHWVTPGSGPYAEYWTDTGPDRQNPEALDALYIAIVRIRAEEGIDLAASLSAETDATAGLVMLEQWADEREPAGPVARVLVTVADIALEYVAQDPSIAGLDGRGEKLLAAFARSLAEILPDDGNLGPRERLAERLFAVALRAGLETLSSNRELLVDEAHVRELLDRSLRPVIDALPADIDRQIDLRRSLEDVAGPVLAAAFGAIAEHQSAFLGDRFDQSGAVGALTQSVLLEARDPGFVDRFHHGGLERIYRAALGVAASRPELFTASLGRDAQVIGSQLLAGFAGVLRESLDDDAQDTGAELGAAFLDVVRQNVRLYADADDDWERLAADLVGDVIDNLAIGLRDGDERPLARIFSRRQLVELGRTAFEQIARTPSMIADDNEEVARLVGLVASLVASDDDLLLSAEDWLAVAAAVFEEAAANPGRLFDLDGSGDFDSLAEELVAMLLTTAADSLRTRGRSGGAVLFGETLRDAIITLLATAAGNAAAASEHRELLREVVAELTAFVADNREDFGNREWLALFNEYLVIALSGEAPEISAAAANLLLEEID